MSLQPDFVVASVFEVLPNGNVLVPRESVTGNVAQRFDAAPFVQTMVAGSNAERTMALARRVELPGAYFCRLRTLTGPPCTAPQQRGHWCLTRAGYVAFRDEMVAEAVRTGHTAEALDALMNQHFGDVEESVRREVLKMQRKIRVYEEFVV